MMNKEIFEEINFVKGFSIIWIVLFHLYKDFPDVFMGQANAVAGIFFGDVCSLGAFGVNLFVICSGFLLAHTHGQKKESYIQFILNRIKKVVPLYYFALSFFIMLDYFIGQDLFTVSFVSVLQHLLFIHTFTDKIFDIEGAFWFMGLIVQLYLFFPLLIKLIEKYKLIYICMGCAFFTVTARFIPFGNLNTNYSVLAFLLDFLAGIIFYRFLFFHKNGFFSRLSIIWGMSSLVLLFTIIFFKIPGFSYGWGVLRPLVSIGLFVCLVNVFHLLSRYFSWVTGFLCLFGIHSYAIYLFHRPFIYKYVTLFSPIFGKILLSLIFLGLMLVAGIVINRGEKIIFDRISR